MDDVLRTGGFAESAHTIGRKSARGRTIEIITRGERRRSWTREQKLEIVAESLGGELTPAEVGRKHGISSGQLYTWRRQLLVVPGAVIERTARFAEVGVAEETPPICAPAPMLPAAPMRVSGTIEITLPSGVSVRVDAAVDVRALGRVLDALARR